MDEIIMSSETIEKSLLEYTLPPNSLKKSVAVRKLRISYPNVSRACFIDGFRNAFSATLAQASTYYYKYFLGRGDTSNTDSNGNGNGNNDNAFSHEAVSYTHLTLPTILLV